MCVTLHTQIVLVFVSVHVCAGHGDTSLWLRGHVPVYSDKDAQLL